jgi:acetyltransferase-like isoleucine patch superfamily enzyme
MRPYLSAFTVYIYNNFITHFPSYKLRLWYLRHIVRIQIGRNTAIHMGCFFTGKRIVIGDNSVINRNCYLDGRGGVEIGDNVSLSPETWIASLTHDPNDPMFGVIPKKVCVGNYVWVGMRAMILPGVTLGEGCVVGAGSVVTKDVGPFTMVAGSPAHFLGERNRDLRYTLSYFPYFDTDVQKSE